MLKETRQSGAAGLQSASTFSTPIPPDPVRTRLRRADLADPLPLHSRSRQPRHDCSPPGTNLRIRNRRLRSARLKEDCFPAPKQARAINAIPSSKNRPNRPPPQRSRPPQIRPRPHPPRRPQNHPRHPVRDRKSPAKSASFLKPSTCPSGKRVARNPIPTPFTAHCHPAYQVSMNSGDTPPLTELVVSSLTYPPLVRHLSADHRHLPAAWCARAKGE